MSKSLCLTAVRKNTLFFYDYYDVLSQCLAFLEDLVGQHNQCDGCFFGLQ